MDNLLLLLFSAIIVMGIGLFVLITITKKGPSQLDVDKYRRRWLEIEQSLKRDEPNSYQLAVIHADKLLDKALKERGIKGETMGERMRSVKEVWTNANAVWSAHKLRNRIAHESDVSVGYDDARRALAGFKLGLKDIGAI